VLRTLDLFSGIGGFARGLEATNFFETSCFVENEPYCRAVLQYHWPDVPVLGDIRDVKGRDLPTRPDVICGGFPCQPFSQAGKQQAQDDPRHLWPEMFRLIRECRPTWIVGENVVGLIRLGLDEVLTDLESEGYATRTFDIPACATGAPHLRRRLWIVAHADSESEPDGTFDGNAGQRQLGFDFVADSDSQRPQGQRTNGGAEGREDQERQAGLRGGAVLADSQREGEGRRRVSKSGKDKSTDGKGSSVKSGRHGQAVADSDIDDGRRGCGAKSSGRESRMEHWSGGECGRSEEWWEVEPEVGRLVDGLPNRVPQLRALGNSIVPQIAQKIGEAIRETYYA